MVDIVQNNFKHSKYGIILRLAKISDAKFILELRTDPKLKKYISYTDNNISKQVNWLKNYKKRELERKEYYFIIENNKKERFGTYRIYNMESNSFTIGSWLCRSNSPPNVAIKADILCKEFGFYQLNRQICKFDIRKGNKKVIAYHKMFNPDLIDENEWNFYYKLDRKNYKSNLESVITFFGI